MSSYKVFHNSCVDIEGMVLEPKFVDYGSIHQAEESAVQIQQQTNNNNNNSSLLSPHSVRSLAPLVVSEENLPSTSSGSKTTNMTQVYYSAGDQYHQRQPLLSNPGKAEKWNLHPSHSSTSNITTRSYYEDVEEDDEDNDCMRSGSGGGGSGSNGIIKINMPPPVREEPRFPQERWKTVFAGLIMCLNFILTLASLAVVHDRVPDRNMYPPLSDVFLDNVAAFDWALSVSEYIIIVSLNSCILFVFFHKHRFIVFRRLFLLMSLLYMYRAITMYVTVLPLSSKTYFCSPRLNHTSPAVIVTRVLTLMSGFGLSVNGKHVFCGDFIYSGHTVILVLSYLFISEYTPKKLYLVHWLYWLLGVIGVVMLQLSHGHYTIDVIIAYYITTRLFWIYHTLANNSSLKQHSTNNLLGRSWWYFAFLYFEGNIDGPVPRQFDWPLPWPKRFHSKSRDS